MAIKIEENLLEILDLLILAKTKDGQSKNLLLNKVDVKIKTLKLFVRMSYDVEAIDQKKYLILQQKILEIGKMLGGWIKYNNTKPTD